MVLVASFVVLAKCADLFVDSAVAFAEKLQIPQLVIGIVLGLVAGIGWLGVPLARGIRYLAVGSALRKHRGRLARTAKEIP